jgi:hypothetical protein
MNIEEEFTCALQGTIDAARAAKYIPTFFIQMLEQYGGVETAKRLLAVKDPQTGLYRLWELNLLSESMEAVVLRDRFRPLFTEQEILEARRRLEELGYLKRE